MVSHWILNSPIYLDGLTSKSQGSPESAPSVLGFQECLHAQFLNRCDRINPKSWLQNKHLTDWAMFPDTVTTNGVTEASWPLELQAMKTLPLENKRTNTASIFVASEICGEGDSELLWYGCVCGGGGGPWVFKCGHACFLGAVQSALILGGEGCSWRGRKARRSPVLAFSQREWQVGLSESLIVFIISPLTPLCFIHFRKDFCLLWNGWS